VNETLMPNLYSSDWYNGRPLQSWREVLQTRDRSTIRLGIARLRQMRIKDSEFTRPYNGCNDFVSFIALSF